MVRVNSPVPQPQNPDPAKSDIFVAVGQIRGEIVELIHQARSLSVDQMQKEIADLQAQVADLQKKSDGYFKSAMTKMAYEFTWSDLKSSAGKRAVSADQCVAWLHGALNSWDQLKAELENNM
jgi:hypothetical protein